MCDGTHASGVLHSRLERKRLAYINVAKQQSGRLRSRTKTKARRRRAYL